MKKWKPIDYSKIHMLWSDCTEGFYCPKCGADIILDSQSGPVECCGKEYRLVAYIEEK